MTNLRQLKQLLNCDYLKDDWNLSYGITKSWNDSLTKLQKNGEYHKNNLLKSDSETALTLFLLGNIDGWKQIETLKTLPRNNNSKWNKTFFDNIREQQDNYREQQDNYDTLPSRDALWAALWAHNKERKEKIFVCKADDLQKSILLFEFEILNAAFHPIESKQDKPFKELSFVNLGSEWSQFDAVLIVPGEELFVFFEAKLLYDMKPSTKNSPKINQIMRNLESAFLLTKHQDSRYKDWKFKYVLICPRERSQGMEYNDVLDSPEKYISSYRDILENKYKSFINKGCYPEYFESFARQIPDCIYKIYWEELGKVLTDHDKNFFLNYFNRLKEADFEKEDIENIKNRFRLAEMEEIAGLEKIAEAIKQK